MRLISKSTSGFLGANMKFLMVPVGSFLIIAILIFFTAKQGLNRLPKLYSNLKLKDSEVRVLESKLETLRGVRTGVLQESNKTLIALPNRASTLWFLAIVKSTAEQNELVLNDVSISYANGEIENILYDFTLTAPDKDNYINFLDNLSKKAPLNELVSFSMSQGEGNYKTRLVLSTYWSELPTNIPAITQPVNNLTQDELSAINNISNLEKPEFTTLDPQINESRTNPFN